MSSWWIYGLSDPTTGALVYIGKTCNYERRRSDHLNAKSAAKGKTPKDLWVSSLLARGLLPVMMPLEVGDGDHEECERAWIAAIRSCGANLLNQTGGGGGLVGYKYTQEQRAAKSAWAKSVPLPQAFIGAGASASRGRKFSAEERKMRSVALKGRLFSPEHIAKLKDAANTPKSRERASARFRGRPATPQAIEAARRAKLGVPLSEDQKAKIRGSRMKSGANQKQSDSKAAWWSEIPKEERSRRAKASGVKSRDAASAAKAKFWASKTPGERSAIAAKSAATVRARRAARGAQ